MALIQVSLVFFFSLVNQLSFFFLVQVHVAGHLDPIRHTYLLDDYLGGAKNILVQIPLMQNAEAKAVKIIKSVHVQAEAEDHVAEVLTH